jgi:alkaline phosphatase D
MGDGEYRKLRESVPIIGVWDDHDFGMDNSGKDYRNKDVAKTLFLDFLDEPINSARRITHDGTYQDYYVINQNIKVHIILLDVRYNMIPDVDILGYK